MNFSDLRLANQLNDEIKELERLKDYLTSEAGEAGENKTERITNLFLNCRNLGSKANKDWLARVMVEAAAEAVKIQINKLTEQFEKL